MGVIQYFDIQWKRCLVFTEQYWFHPIALFQVLFKLSKDFQHYNNSYIFCNYIVFKKKSFSINRFLGSVGFYGAQMSTAGTANTETAHFSVLIKPPEFPTDSHKCLGSSGF